MKKMLSLGVLALLGMAGAALAVPPLDFDYGQLNTATVPVTHDGNVGTNQVKWYRFVTPGVDAAVSSYLDIDTNLDPAAPLLVDSLVALYNSDGDFVSSSDDEGTGTRSQLSFGAGGRAGVGGSPYNGQNGATLAAGVYYVAVTGFPVAVAFGPNFAVAPANAGVGYVGNYRLQLRSGRMGTTTPPPIDSDLGNLRGVNSQGVSADIANSGSAVHWVKFHIDFATSAAGYFCDLHTIGSSLPGSFSNQDTVIALFDGAGNPVAGGINDDYTAGTTTGGGNLSGLSFGRTAGARSYTVGAITMNNFAGQAGAALAAGDYYVGMVRYGFQTPSAGFVFGSTAVESTGMLKLTVATNMPPVADYDMGIIKALNSPARTPDLALNGNEPRWITFRTEAATSAATVFCDIHTLGSRLNNDGFQGNDTTIGLYAADGTLITYRDDYNSLYSALSFGRTSGPRTYTESADTLDTFNGFTAAVLPAGQYYVAIVGYGSYNFLSNFRASTGTGYVGTVRLNVATNMGAALTEDLGLLNRVTSPRVSSQVALAAGAIKWFHFRTTSATGAATYFVDMTTIGSVLNSSDPNDTEIGLYSVTGALVNNDDDINAIGESAISYGLTSPARTYPAPIGNLAGDFGAVLPAGDYYVSVSGYNSGFSNDFNTTSASTYVGVVQLRLFSNLPAPGCNAADVGGLGGSIGPDGALTPDDIVVYLGAFFANNLAVADLVTVGGNPPPDGQITADDLIFFLSQFFSPCNP